MSSAFLSVKCPKILQIFLRSTIFVAIQNRFIMYIIERSFHNLSKEKFLRSNLEIYKVNLEMI